ncbi:hypothetical protein BH09ACT8_BH09ACT8_62930 [soil metagenome]
MLGSVAGGMAQPGPMTKTDLELVAVRAAFDRMLIRKGLATAAHLDLIRHGIRTRGVVTAVCVPLG